MSLVTWLILKTSQLLIYWTAEQLSIRGVPVFSTMEHRDSFHVISFHQFQVIYTINTVQLCPSKKHLLSRFVSNCCAGYKTIKKIGEGTFSDVVKTQSLKDGKLYACKTMKQTINRYVSSSTTLSCAQVIQFYHMLCVNLWNLSQLLDNPCYCHLVLPLTLQWGGMIMSCQHTDIYMWIVTLWHHSYILVNIFLIWFLIICSLSSLEQANNLREVQAMKRLSPHANIIQLHELILWVLKLSFDYCSDFR